MRSHWIPNFVSLLLVGSTLLILKTWMQVPLTFTPIRITSGFLEENQLPFYAQFIVTQRIVMKDPALVTGLTIPWQSPKVPTSIVVDLRRNNILVQRWRIRPTNKGVREDLQLPLDFPRYIDGIIEITFSVPTLDGKHQQAAPLLFMEPFDRSFPLGNYRIAHNEKSGDVNMTIFAQRQRGEVLQQAFLFHPIRGTGVLAQIAAVLILIGTLPSVATSLKVYNISA